MRNSRGALWLPVIGRLKPGVSLEQAQTEMNGIAARQESTYPDAKGFGAHLVPLHKQLVGDVERSLLVLMAAVACVLLIACANLGNLMLGRTAARRKELAIRTALGAKRGRLIRQIVTETFVIAIAGSAVGLLLAFWATEFFIQVGDGAIPRADMVTIDGRVLLFTLALAAVAALLAGLVPALQASRAAVREHLAEGGREGGSGGSRRTRSALIAAEMALAFVLLAGAGILVRTLWSMQGADRGSTPTASRLQPSVCRKRSTPRRPRSAASIHDCSRGSVPFPGSSRRARRPASSCRCSPTPASTPSKENRCRHRVSGSSIPSRRSRRDSSRRSM
jgi:hypothetical protein